MYHTIWVNFEAKIWAGAGAGPNWRFRLQPNTLAPAPKPCLKDFYDISLKKFTFVSNIDIRKLKTPASVLQAMKNLTLWNFSNLWAHADFPIHQTITENTGNTLDDSSEIDQYSEVMI